jgi:hypothetical protein
LACVAYLRVARVGFRFDGLSRWGAIAKRPRRQRGVEKSQSRQSKADLVGLKTKVLELPAPIGVGITQAFEIDAAGEATFDRCFDELRSKECQRKRQIDLAHRASFASCKLFGAGGCARYDFAEATAPACDGADEPSAAFGTFGPEVFSELTVRQEDLSGLPLPLLCLSTRPARRGQDRQARIGLGEVVVPRLWPSSLREM